ncbi:MAG: phenylacetate--CoA ligase [Clostridia bacterium]|jgi:phenylacetate-CoA ligase|nr:phenylacetate--CoA ligase [Clostridia bacterium]
MAAYRKYWDEELETMSREKLQELQLKLLKDTVELCYAKSPYYRNSFDQAGVKPSDLKSLEDLKKFPTIDKIVLRSRQQAAPDFGDLLCVPEEEIVYISVSSGSTGVPTASPFTAQDFDDYQDYQARLFWSSGMRPTDRYCHALNFTLFVGGPDVLGAQKVGALCIWAGAIPAERLLAIFQQWKPNITWTTPSYAWFLGETAKEQGIDPLKDLNIKKIFVAGEPGGSIPETREQIEALWGADLYDYYGLSDIFGACAGMCEKKEGLHWAEDHIFVEVIDPDTGEEVPEGERGELVLTSLKKKARPLIRFRTGDIVSYTSEKCSCGRTHLRLHGIHGRLDDMLIIKGVNVFPSDIEMVIRKNNDLTGEYRLVVTEEHHMAVLTVEAEHAPHVTGDTQRLVEEIQLECVKILGIRPRVKILPPNTLPRATHKAKRVFDERKPA